MWERRNRGRELRRLLRIMSSHSAMVFPGRTFLPEEEEVPFPGFGAASSAMPLAYGFVRLCLSRCLVQYTHGSKSNAGSDFGSFKWVLILITHFFFFLSFSIQVLAFRLLGHICNIHFKLFWSLSFWKMVKIVVLSNTHFKYFFIVKYHSTTVNYQKTTVYCQKTTI